MSRGFCKLILEVSRIKEAILREQALREMQLQAQGEITRMMQDTEYRANIHKME